MFVPAYSESGSNRRVKEEQIFFFWMQFLKDCQRGRLQRNVISLSEIMDNAVDGESTSKMVLSLADVLQFITGSPTTPLVPFAGNILFDHEIGKDAERRVESNTCALQVTFPVSQRYLSSCDTFMMNFTDDIYEGPGFGKV